MASRQLVFDILANNKASGPIKQVGDDLDRQQQQWDSWKRAGTVAAGVVLAGLSAYAIGSISAGEAASTSNARISNIAQSMNLYGDSADDVSDRLVNLANTVARQTGVDQNAIKATQAKLLTFRELAESADDVGGNFDRATTAAIDLAAAGFGSAEENAVSLGKALNDPITGLSALRRNGITFTEAEEDMIRAMVEANDVAGAQDLILAAIETQVGGTAEATANSTDRMSVGFSQLKETVGLALLPAIGALTEKGLALTGWMTEHQGVTMTAIGVLGGLAATVIGVSVATKVATAAQVLWKGATIAATVVTKVFNATLRNNPIGIVVTALAALVAGVIWAYNNVDWFRAGVDAAFAWIKTAIATVADWFTGTVVPAWNTAYDAVAAVVQTVSEAIGAAWQWIADAAGAAWNFIDTWVLLPFKIQIALWQRVFEVAGQVIGSVWEWIRSAAGTAWDWIRSNVFPPFETAIGILRGAFEFYGDVAARVWGAVRDAIGSAWSWVRDNVFPPFTTAVEAIQTTFERVSDGIGIAWDRIREAAAAPVRFVVNTVYNDGIRRVVQNVLDALGVNFTLPTASLAFASGGVLPGYTPGADVHHFWSPTAGALHLSGGEGIIRPDALRALGGESWLQMINRTRGKGAHFADGGVFGGGSGGLSEFWEWITSPARAIASLVTGPVNALLGQITSTPWGKALAAMPPKIIDGLVAKVGALLSPLGGAGPEFAGAVNGWLRPAAGPVTSNYGPRGTSFHAGIDIGGSGPTWAAANGQVVRWGWNTLAGRTGIGIVMSHGGGTYTYYGHNPVGGVVVSPGQTVAAGQRIGAQGATGNATGNHLHFELHQGGLGRTVNPRSLGVFDDGGIMWPGSLGANLTGRPERVLTPSNTESFDRLVDLLERGGLPAASRPRVEVVRVEMLGRGHMVDSIAADVVLRIDQGVPA